MLGRKSQPLQALASIACQASSTMQQQSAQIVGSC
jgi:hypothetical protein